VKVIHFICICSALVTTFALGQTNPVPFVNQPLVPMSAAPGGSSFTLAVNGTGFVSESAVQWNGTALPTTFVNKSQLTATVAASEIAKAGTVVVTVMNPSPGGGTSNAQYFGISHPVSTLTFSSYYDFALQMGQSAVYPYAISADFNRDGKLDLAEVDGYQTLAVQLGNGDGSFQTPVTYTVGIMNCTLAAPVAADLNGDGKLDIAVPACGVGAVDVLLGNGDGTFQSPHSFATANAPYYIVVGDFNGDGKLDIATANSDGDTSTFSVSVLLGNGDGTFQNHVDYASQVANPAGMVVGDFNGHGKLDLAFADRFTGIWIFAGNGDGTFSPPTQLTFPGLYADGLITADVNGDGRLDLVALGNPTGNTSAVYVFLGNGDGTFQPGVSYGVGNFPNFMAAGDLNADGKLDLVLASSDIAGSVNVLLGNGDGTFQPAVNFPTGLQSCDFTPLSLTLGDFNGDGTVDVAVLNSVECYVPYPNLTVLLQATLPAAVALPTTLTFSQQAIGTTSAPQSVTLTNTGQATLTISSIGLTGSDSGDYGESNGCGAALAANANCQINVTFTPTTGGTRNATLSVATNSPGSPQIVLLSGTTPPAPAVTLSPLSVSFPGQYVGTSGLPQTVTLTNTGSANLAVTNVAVNPGDFGVLNACGSTVTAGSSCSVGVFFDPTTTGTRTGTLTVADNAGGSPQTVTLSGTGEDFSIAPSSSSSATVTAGQTAIYTVAVAPDGGFNQTVQLSCSGAPLQSTCSLSSSSVSLNGASPASVTVTVKTTGASASLVRPHVLPPSSSALALWLGALGLFWVVLPYTSRSRPAKRIGGRLCAVALLCVLSAGTWSACGGGNANSGAGGGTPAGPYTLTVTGSFTSGSTNLTHSTELALVVK